MLGVMSFNLIGLCLLILICANVALLMFARAATRESEIIVRNALGASRARITMQLFTEALVLCGLAALLGLALASLGLDWALRVFETEISDQGGRLPFWITSGLSPATVLYALLLALLAAALAGIVPALKITRGLGLRLKEITAGGGGIHFGGIWTAVIVAQVAVTVVFPAVAFFMRRDRVQMETQNLGFPDEEFISVQLAPDRDVRLTTTEESRALYLQQFASTVTELEQRIRAEPAVIGVTFARRLPRMYHEWNQIEVDAGAVEPPDARGHRVGKSTIGIDYFDVLGTPLLSGRPFHSGDLAADARVVIVSQPFVDEVLGGRNPIGRRVRYIASESERMPRTDGEWYEIVGVARDLGTKSGYGSAGIYHPVARGGEYPIYMAVHVRGRPDSFAPRLRGLAMAVDPTLRLNLIRPMNELINGDLKVYDFWFKLTVAVCAIALLLSLTGIYAVMSFTVSRRTREIGIRVALGADARRIARAIFWRPVAQVGVGILVGTAFIALLVATLTGGLPSARQALLVALYSILMMAVCMLACVVPTRRALRVQPTDALKTEG
jgi:predicted permease